MSQMVIDTIKDYLKMNKIDGIIVDSWQNVLYASGFTGYGDALLLITQNDQFIFTDDRYTVQVKEQCPAFRHVDCAAHNTAKIKEILKENGIKKVGFEEKGIEYYYYENLYQKLGVKLCPVSFLFEGMRTYKRAEEIERIQKACDIAAEALRRTLAYIKTGVSEIEIAARLEFEMRMGGAEKPSFDTVVASGIRGSMPHGTASTKIINDGDGVTIDFGAFYKGMCSDCTRTYFVGEPSAKMREIYNIVYEAQQAAIDGYREGMTGFDVDKIARDIITDAGYGECFGHATGHGVGIDVHEGVGISVRSKTVLEPGMVFSIEPGIYVPGVGGVRIEDLVTIRDGKIEILTKGLPKELTVL